MTVYTSWLSSELPSINTLAALAQAMLQKNQESEDRLLWASKPDKLQQAKEEITEWESRMTQYERDFERISTVVRKEVTRFEKEISKDFKNHVIKYLAMLLHSQQQLAKYWEAFFPESKAISRGTKDTRAYLCDAAFLYTVLLLRWTPTDALALAGLSLSTLPHRQTVPSYSNQRFI